MKHVVYSGENPICPREDNECGKSFTAENPRHTLKNTAREKAIRRETTAQFAQRALELRGYVVIGSTYPLKIGSIETLDDQPGTATDAFGIVIAQADRADMIAQLEALEPWRKRGPIHCSYFYKLVAE